METIRIFVYDQILNLQIADDNTLNIEDRIVYTKPINLFKGIDNVIKVLIKNSDQKVVDITTLTFYAELVKSPQQDFVGSFTLVTTSALLGEAKLTIPAYILNPQEIGNYYILIKYSSGGNLKQTTGSDIGKKNVVNRNLRVGTIFAIINQRKIIGWLNPQNNSTCPETWFARDKLCFNPFLVQKIEQEIPNLILSNSSQQGRF